MARASANAINSACSIAIQPRNDLNPFRQLSLSMRGLLIHRKQESPSIAQEAEHSVVMSRSNTIDRLWNTKAMFCTRNILSCPLAPEPYLNAHGC
jgi:hypothetical protein